MIRVMFCPGLKPPLTKPRTLGIAAFTGITTSVPGSKSNSAYLPRYRMRGTSNFLLKAAAYHDPSIRDSGVFADGVGPHTAAFEGADAIIQRGEGITGAGSPLAVGQAGKKQNT